MRSTSDASPPLNTAACYISRLMSKQIPAAAPPPAAFLLHSMTPLIFQTGAIFADTYSPAFSADEATPVPWNIYHWNSSQPDAKISLWINFQLSESELLSSEFFLLCPVTTESRALGFFRYANCPTAGSKKVFVLFLFPLPSSSWVGAGDFLLI